MYHSSAAGLLGLAGAERTLVVAPEGAIAVAVIRPRNGGQISNIYSLYGVHS